MLLLPSKSTPIVSWPTSRFEFAIYHAPALGGALTSGRLVGELARLVCRSPAYAPNMEHSTDPTPLRFGCTNCSTLAQPMHGFKHCGSVFWRVGYLGIRKFKRTELRQPGAGPPHFPK